MRYSDLVQFEPIESVIQLLDANKPEEAGKLISTYVFSEDMANRVANSIIPQLSFDDAVDHRGVLVVGNYGTGKSHLMSVLSLVAENAAYAPMVLHPKVAAAAAAIAGKFKVHRIEISSEMSLRGIITQELEAFLEKCNVDYSFPSPDQVTNNKVAFEEMMAAFAEVHPDHGVLLVVDEFLDYLRSRKDHDLILDLSFLREIGEVTKHLRFRFVAGTQEAIFDSARFQHVADSMRRVNERFAQVLLARQDINFVVSERMLRKSPDQEKAIREHLQPFSRFYGAMSERMDDYVRLFPVHPEYIGTFGRLVFTEKRGALVTIRDQMQAVLEDEVPTDRPGLISYDKFWETVKSNQALRSDPDIGSVLKVSEVLSERVERAFTRPTYKEMALRIINALSVHRLTTGGDIYVAVGPTASELRDTLCLYHPGIDGMGGDPDADLLSLVHTTLREILKTVNGQFISRIPDTEQFFLDLKKNIDYDTQIEKRAETLPDDVLDRAYYSAVRELMEQFNEDAYVPGHQIWQYWIEWQDHRVERSGYLFFGAPNDRPTAQPERDFYIYFIQPFEPPKYQDEFKSDEVFFRLKDIDGEIKKFLTFYAAAQDLAATSSGSTSTVYREKAGDALHDISRWLQKKQMLAYEVSYQGKEKTLGAWVSEISLRDRAQLGPEDRIKFRDVVNVVSGIALASRFVEVAPEYPIFSMLVTEENRKQAIGSALRAVAGGQVTRDAATILDGLKMLDGSRLDPLRSCYAQSVLTRLKEKEHGQVLKRQELLNGNADLEYFLRGKYRLEPDLFVIVLCGLIYTGDIVLVLPGTKIDSGNMDELSDWSLTDLQQFKHVEAPKELNVAVLRSLFEMLGRPPGLAQQAAQGSEEAVRNLQDEIAILVRRALEATTDMQERFSFWGRQILQDEEINNRRVRLNALKAFFESLAIHNTVGRLKNLRIEHTEIETQKDNLSTLIATEGLMKLISELGSAAGYLSQAGMALPSGHEWIAEMRAVQKQTIDSLVASQISKQPVSQHKHQCRHVLNKLQQKYIAVYAELHNRARLDALGSERKSSFQSDQRLVSLSALAQIPLLPATQVKEVEDHLSKLKGCSLLVGADLLASPVCPHCNFRPDDEVGETASAVSMLQHIDSTLDRLYENWVRTLVSNLEDAAVQSKLELLDASTRKIVTNFTKKKTLPKVVTSEFVSAMQEVLSGLERVTLTSEEIKEGLIKGGMPATRDGLHERFKKFIQDQCGNRDPEKLRFVVE